MLLHCTSQALALKSCMDVEHNMPGQHDISMRQCIWQCECLFDSHGPSRKAFSLPDDMHCACAAVLTSEDDAHTFGMLKAVIAVSVELGQPKGLMNAGCPPMRHSKAAVRGFRRAGPLQPQDPHAS